MEELDMIENAELLWKFFAADKKKNFIAVIIPPVVRVTLGERFGLARGEDCMGKVAAVLRVLGADAVVDAAAAQDVVTLLQVQALKSGKDKPALSVGCGKICGVENSAPNADEVGVRLVKKHYRAQNPEKSVRVVTVTPCENAKKRVPGADVALSVEELALLLESTVLNLRLVEKEAWDMPLGVASAAAYITKTLGGESEAIARCLLKDKSRMQICRLVYSGLYGNSVRKVAEICDGEKVWKFAVTACADEVKKILEEQQNGEVDYDFVEYKKEGGCLCAIGMDGREDKEQTAKLRAVGLRYLSQNRTAVSADVCPTAATLLRTWETMVSTGEAFEENEPFVEEVYEDEVVEEIVEAMLAEEAVEEPIAEEAPVEEAVEEPVAEETPVEETVEEPVAEEAPVEETVEEPVAEEAPIEEAVEEPVAEEAPVEETVEEPVAEEAPVEEVVEEPVAEEAPIEEAVEEPVVEEAPVEETVEEPVLEEAPVEETVEEPVVEETPVEETVEEPVVEEAPVEETVEEPVVEEAPVEETVEEPVLEEAPVEEVVEEPVVEETPVEEVVEEPVVEEAPVEEVVEEPVAEDAPVEETVEEDDEDGRNPYSRRLSTRERRKIRNKKKNKNKNKNKK